MRNIENASTTALITGASSGIGEALARIFNANGHKLVLVARRVERLEALSLELTRSEGDVIPIAMDLAKQKAPAQLVKQLQEKSVSIDILVNNAGVTYAGLFSEMKPSDIQSMLQLNSVSVSMLTRLLLPGMLERRYGKILNIASISAFQPVPSLALYAASKSLVLSLSEALSEELKNTGITATALCPGLTDTAMMDNTEKFEASLPDFLIADVNRVAQEGYDACMKGQAVHIPGVANRLGTLWSQYQPRWLLRTVSGAIARQLMKH